MDVAIQKAQKRLDFVANDKEALREYHMREMALSDWTSGVNHALRENAKGQSGPDGSVDWSGALCGPCYHRR
jgi:hypothetical protein